MRYILDACALLSYLNNETGYDIVLDLIEKAENDEIEVYMSIVNLAEVHYVNIRDDGDEMAAIILEDILTLPIRIVSTITDTIFQEAARLKASYKCSLADAIGLATALELSGQFVTSDHHEIEAVAENEAIALLWLPPHPKNS